MNTPRYALIDVEVGLKDHKIHDIGALRDDNAVYHRNCSSSLMTWTISVDIILSITMRNTCLRMSPVIGNWLIRFIFRPCYSRNVHTITS